MQNAFGAGAAWAFPSGSNPTPSRFGVAQDWSADFSRTTKPLFGQNATATAQGQLPVAVGISTMVVKGKITFARFAGRLFNDIFFNGTSATGQAPVSDNEGASAIPTTPFQITVTNGATFADDLGVINSSTGIPFTRVASSPAAGQYSVNTTTGVYTFASADNVSAISVRISYRYTTTGGQLVTMSNAPVGFANTFTFVGAMIFNSLKGTLRLNQCVSSKLSVATQLEDFAKPDMEFDAYADSTDTLGTWSFPEVN